ncbi:hypothetical protein [Parafilimonas terrae]|uniref:Uncharacterized protein n=1 Tax=Parafilimonas terrae TaxID=1465490 RepID=A0A1I5RBC8_9BACT|nr:hypothetical protein [Parafilimonas terrae]SFP55647.1 hypothetical protein SAMN05444277_101165 [Parafilimonas terrae]
MIKHLFWTLLLFSCHSNSNNDSQVKMPPPSDTAQTLTTEKESNELKKTVRRFDNHQRFEIVSFKNTLNKNTTDTDTSKCSGWKLTESDIEKIIKNSEPIGGTTWDLNFLVLTCTKSVKVVQHGQQFDVEINAASFFLVNNGDTSVFFGDYKDSDRKYFIEGPNTSE